MKNLLNIKKLSLLVLAVLTLVLSSCSNDDSNPADSIVYVAETSNFYGQNPAKDDIRNALVGKWLDEQNNLVLDVKSWKKDPDFGIDPHASEFIYQIDSKVEKYVLGENFWWGEIAMNKNNVRIGGDFYIMVEGNSAKLFVLGNQIRVIKMHK